MSLLSSASTADVSKVILGRHSFSTASIKLKLKIIPYNTLKCTFHNHQFNEQLAIVVYVSVLQEKSDIIFVINNSGNCDIRYIKRDQRSLYYYL